MASYLTGWLAPRGKEFSYLRSRPVI